MKGFAARLGRLWRCRSGATAVEFALVILPFVLMVLGTVEFGRALHMKNEMSYAADRAARMVLIGQVPAAASDSEARSRLDAAVRENFRSGDPKLLRITVDRVKAGETHYRVVSMRYPLRLLVPGFKKTPVMLDLTRHIPIA